MDHSSPLILPHGPGTRDIQAGDEQDFDTPGSALDGWSREELSPSMAWRAVPTQPGWGGVGVR